jgi:hypothetical protein
MDGEKQEKGWDFFSSCPTLPRSARGKRILSSRSMSIGGSSITTVQKMDYTEQFFHNILVRQVWYSSPIPKRRTEFFPCFSEQVEKLSFCLQCPQLFKRIHEKFPTWMACELPTAYHSRLSACPCFAILHLPPKIIFALHVEFCFFHPIRK